jgi:predicted nucleotidyltransferase
VGHDARLPVERSSPLGVYRGYKTTGTDSRRNRTAFVMSEGMNRQEILDRLRENERALRERGVSHAALFGSRARGDDRPYSDIDIMIEIAPDFPMDVFQYFGVVHAIEDLFPLPVDVSDLTAQKPHVRPSAQRDAVYAF